TTGNKVLRNNENIGTVLFEKGDCTKRCWTNEEFIILNSRRMFQDILPKVKVIDYQNDQYIALLMDYFNICFESVGKLSIGKSKHLILKALADVMGGYLRTYILPITKQSYYEGNIKYNNVKKLFQLYDELKDFLRTNGFGWSKPRHEMTPMKEMSLITTTPSESSVGCNGLITFPIHGDKNNRRLQRRHIPRRRNNKRFLSRIRSRRFLPLGYNDASKPDESSIVPIPFLDDEIEPNSIAVPFKLNSLQSLYSPQSAFVLVKYYTAGLKCIISRSKTQTTLDHFNNNFLSWLQQSVKERLNDEKWYPAFGGVSRIIFTLEKTGIYNERNKKTKNHFNEVLPKIEVEFNSAPIDDVVPPINKDNEAIIFGTTELIIIAIVSALLVWLLVGLSLVCYKYLSRHSEECSPCESPNTPVAVLYENTDYSKGERCISKTIVPKGPIEKLKEWYKNKFGRCPGGCQDRYDEERCLAAISYTSKDTIPGSRVCQRKKYVKSTSASPSSSPVERTIFRQNVCYSSDASSTVSEDPGKRRR
ncbi:hypothetical protein M0802_009878, partial [Mischocyttarus mexicanus]